MSGAAESSVAAPAVSGTVPAPNGRGASGSRRRAQIVGIGLIGGSIGMALRQRGWTVTGADIEPARGRRALAIGALDALGVDPEAEITFIATPAGAVPEAAHAALDGPGVVTDVAGVKGPIAAAVAHPRFVAGHPMAGSEQEGLDGADPDLFIGATWVLTPTDHTSPDTYAYVQTVVGGLGANVVAMPPARHDDLVAVVSHVPHLTAATLMNLAADAAEEQSTLLRLAAGGFRDMTRIAAGHPGIWPDVCIQNRDGILQVIDGLVSELTDVRRIVAEGDRDGLLKRLERAREARTNLPSGAPDAARTAELRIPVLDRPGVLAEVLTLAGDLGINVFDVEIAHSAEGDRGVLVLVIDDGASVQLRESLAARGYRTSVRTPGP
ncbi:prephenate dehydrogenase/arogenate dehydrogenase family protein [Acidiferrimicrobium sp. IK]|uniref:prephenate dehydrogenase/arogenate dehydrogenase family protein n=1 Tax=Acidiferrimicrobium sp. IK TaxID=2871700 RepID=UPI0021CAEC1C|nr:prephenate dehydrogenase/arogenate dehydrogenase family protein [Acidiferrimicrobium sp. IK]MCU4184729.1 prephenate dehydrogenase/arogenate dehydrogenase family protein [Acidiferrimicrobium sp. IK]